MSLLRIMASLMSEDQEPSDSAWKNHRLDDVPQSFYPGMWLRRLDEGHSWQEPTAEVIRVGRTRVLILPAGRSEPVRMHVTMARDVYRKVYESPPPQSLPEWIRPGADFTAFDCGTLRIRCIRWGFASVETDSGVLVFWALSGLVAKAKPRRSIWERLTDD